MEINDSPFLCCIQFLGFDNDVEKCKSRKDSVKWPINL